MDLYHIRTTEGECAQFDYCAHHYFVIISSLFRDGSLYKSMSLSYTGLTVDPRSRTRDKSERLGLVPSTAETVNLTERYLDRRYFVLFFWFSFLILIFIF